MVKKFRQKYYLDWVVIRDLSSHGFTNNNLILILEEYTVLQNRMMITLPAIVIIITLDLSQSTCVLGRVCVTRSEIVRKINIRTFLKIVVQFILYVKNNENNIILLRSLKSQYTINISINDKYFF